MQEQPSSYLDYIEKRKTEWVKPDEILTFFSRNNPNLSYEAFVKEQKDLSYIGKLTLEEDD